LRRHVARSSVGALTKEMLLHLFGKLFSGADICKVEPVFVDEHGLVLDPALPGFLRHALENSLAELAGLGREIQPLGLAPEFDALHQSCHCCGFV
jgi:hypothetical protein